MVTSRAMPPHGHSHETECTVRFRSSHSFGIVGTLARRAGSPARLRVVTF